jgi:hypothetical protein
MSRPINPKSKRQLALKNGVNYQTFKNRMIRGWDKMDALIIDTVKTEKITDSQIIDCEKLGLTISRSACFLGISQQVLSRRIKKLGINWRGKGESINR